MRDFFIDSTVPNSEQSKKWYYSEWKTMTFTAKEDYGLRAVLDIAIHSKGEPVQANEIASRQNIPDQFLEQVIAQLRRGDVVRSIRGKSGGYLLTRSAELTFLGQILRSLSGSLVPESLMDSQRASTVEGHAVVGIWRDVDHQLRSHLDDVSIADIIARIDGNDSSFMMHI
jgi:Rrf2 family protein